MAVSTELRLTQSLALWQEAERLIPGGSQTNSKRPGNYAFGRYPIFAARAEGCRIWDVDGNEYIDFVNGLGPISLGYQYPAVDEAIRTQLSKGVVAGLLWPAEVEAARALTEVIPCAEMVRFLKGGGEATAAAARIARAATGRHIIFNSGYRGWPDTWSAGRTRGVPPDLAKYVITYSRDLQKTADALGQYNGQVAAIFADLPYDGSLGREYLQELRRLADAHGALLCFDEIVTGFRMAVAGAQEYTGVVPDLAAFAKGMANGMPLAAVVGRRHVMEAAADAVISITYGGEALSLAACAATVREYREKDVIGHLYRVGQQLMDGVNEAAAHRRVPFRCTGYASMSAMEFHLPPDKVGPAWELFLAECARGGALFRRGGLNMMTFSHMPADVATAVDIADRALQAVAAAGYTGELPAGAQSGSQQVGPMSRGA